MRENLPIDKPLKALIKEAGITQKELANQLGVSYTAVKFYVSGVNRPSIDIFADICRVLNQSPKTVMKALGIDTTGIPDDSPN
ncbi:MAG: helix-turn-helix domain-containing protein [Microcystis aeruginosa]|uniref:Transcriptional regulator, XRE family n=1 Tax=Microcystis aeruginosa PCC 9443 TaxID=1160281 RepID=I4G2I4_MICAE